LMFRQSIISINLKRTQTFMSHDVEPNELRYMPFLVMFSHDAQVIDILH
jgi:hypothetical protein